MNTYTLQDLLNRWARGELTVEQLTGHILQHMVRLEAELALMKHLVVTLQAAQSSSDES